MSVLSLIVGVFNNMEFFPFIFCIGLSVIILLGKLGYLEFLKNSKPFIYVFIIEK